MKENTASIQRNFMWNTVGSLVYQGCLWAMTILVAALASLEDVGVLRLCMSISNMLFTVAIYGIRAFQVSDLSGKYSDKDYVFARFFTCGAAFAACLVPAVVQGKSFAVAASIMVYMLFRISEAIMDVLHGIDQRADRLDIAGKSFTMRGIISIVSFALVLGVSKNLLLALVVMALCSFAIVLLYDVPAAKRLGNFTRPFTLINSASLLKECFPLVCYAFLNTAIANIPVLFLESIHGSAVLGIYSAVSAPAVIIQMGATYIFTPFITGFARLYTDKNQKGFYGMIAKMSLAILAIGVCGVIGGALLGNWGLHLIYPTKPETWQNVGLLVPTIISAVVTAFVLFYNMLLTIIRDFKGLVISNLLGIVFCVGACPVLIRLYSLQGTNLALLLSLCVQLAGLMCFGFYKSKKHFATGNGDTPTA